LTWNADWSLVYLEEVPVEIYGGRNGANTDADEDRYVDEEITAV